eukprot:949390_1
MHAVRSRSRKRRHANSAESDDELLENGNAAGQQNEHFIRYSAEAHNEILRLAECPVCHNIMKDRHIFQCPAGHTICSDCKASLRQPPKCPECRQSVGDVRCRFAEQILEKLCLPCENVDFGCQKMISSAQRATHLAECMFSPFECPGNMHNVCDCAWKGRADQIYDHMGSAHSDCFDKVIHEFNEEPKSWDIEDCLDIKQHGTFWMRFASAGAKQFLMYAHIDSDHFHLIIQHAGRSPAGRYRLQLQLSGGGEITKSYPILSITKKVKEGSDLVVHKNMLKIEKINKKMSSISVQLQII